MPRRDRTGPMGAGPMTGRRAGNDMPGFNNTAALRQGPGFGFRGAGHGRRCMFYATGLPGWRRFNPSPPAPKVEVDSLKAQADWLKEQLDLINKRIEEMDQ